MKIKNFRRGQSGIEYLVIVGFVTFIVISILLIATFYSGSIQDNIRISQVGAFANKIISSSESVFYSGEPSKATILAYLPEGIESVEIIENNLVITTLMSSGKARTAYSSNVPITGVLPSSSGLHKIKIEAGQTSVSITSA